MARRTKLEAEKTRHGLLDAAEKVFYKKGIARTSLEHIARAAKVTRGAIYWHFRDKTALCEAMGNRVFLPQEEILQQLAEASSATPLDDLRQACCDALIGIATDKRRQRVVSILMLRCEYIDDMAPIMERRRDCKNNMLASFERLFIQAQKNKTLNPDWPPQLAALSLQAMMSGLINRSLENPKTFDLATQGPACLDAFFKSVRVVSKTRSA